MRRTTDPFLPDEATGSPRFRVPSTHKLALSPRGLEEAGKFRAALTPLAGHNASVPRAVQGTVSPEGSAYSSPDPSPRGGSSERGGARKRKRRGGDAKAAKRAKTSQRSKRLVTTPAAINILEPWFQQVFRQKGPTEEQVEAVMRALNDDEEAKDGNSWDAGRVRIWYNNRRAKHRRTSATTSPTMPAVIPTTVVSAAPGTHTERVLGGVDATAGSGMVYEMDALTDESSNDSSDFHLMMEVASAPESPCSGMDVEVLPRHQFLHVPNHRISAYQQGVAEEPYEDAQVTMSQRHLASFGMCLMKEWIVMKCAHYQEGFHRISFSMPIMPSMYLVLVGSSPATLMTQDDVASYFCASSLRGGHSHTSIMLCAPVVFELVDNARIKIEMGCNISVERTPPPVERPFEPPILQRQGAFSNLSAPSFGDDGRSHSFPTTLLRNPSPMGVEIQRALSAADRTRGDPDDFLGEGTLQ